MSSQDQSSANTGNTSPTARRDSNSSKFSGLMNQKRASTDATADARRASFNDQKPAAGVIGQMWNNFTKGK